MSLKLMMLVDSTTSAIEAEKAGVDRIFFDLEVINKRERQRGRNTVISNNSIEEVKDIKKVLNKSELLVRVNPMYSNTEEEVNRVITDGADLVMLPMVIDEEDARRFVSYVSGRAKTVLLLETAQSLARMQDILDIKGIDEIFFGLNDMHISMGLDFMFEVLSGGIVEYMANIAINKGIPFGFGGIAKIGEGKLPSELILGEHIWLSSSSVILSRTFKENGVEDVDLSLEIKKVRETEKVISEWKEEEFIENRKKVKSIVSKIVQSYHST